MAQTYSGSINLQISSQAGKTAAVATASDPVSQVLTKTLSGAGYTHAHGEITLTNSTPVTLDLAGADATIVNGLGKVAFTKLRYAFFWVTSASTGIVISIGGNTNAAPLFGAAAHKAAIGPDGFLAMGNGTDGWTLTDSTADKLDITRTSGTGSVTVRYLLIGDGTVS